MKTIGQRIKERRSELKFTQRSLGKRAGVAHVTISQWERDETSPRGDNLFRLAEALGVEPGWIIRGEGGHEQEGDVIVITPLQRELLDLFSRLPASEKEMHMTNLRERVKECEDSFSEHLKTKSKAEILEILKNLEID